MTWDDYYLCRRRRIAMRRWMKARLPSLPGDLPGRCGTGLADFLRVVVDASR